MLVSHTPFSPKRTCIITSHYIVAPCQRTRLVCRSKGILESRTWGPCVDVIVTSCLHMPSRSTLWNTHNKIPVPGQYDTYTCAHLHTQPPHIQIAEECFCLSPSHVLGVWSHLCERGRSADELYWVHAMFLWRPRGCIHSFCLSLSYLLLTFYFFRTFFYYSPWVYMSTFTCTYAWVSDWALSRMLDHSLVVWSWRAAVTTALKSWDTRPHAPTSTCNALRTVAAFTSPGERGGRQWRCERQRFVSKRRLTSGRKHPALPLGPTERYVCHPSYVEDEHDSLLSRFRCFFAPSVCCLITITWDESNGFKQTHFSLRWSWISWCIPCRYSPSCMIPMRRRCLLCPIRQTSARSSITMVACGTAPHSTIPRRRSQPTMCVFWYAWTDVCSVGKLSHL